MEYLLTFLEGIASFISPCLLPMIPIYISYFAGDDKSNTRKVMVNSSGFVLGFTISFMVLAILASTVGGIVSEHIQYVKVVFGILIMVMGLNYMGLLKVGILNKTKMFAEKPQSAGFLRMVLFGMLFSISWTPCIGTFLSAALLLIAKERDMVQGMILILVYSLGLGIPFIISAVLLDKLRTTFDFIKQHYDIIKKISGIILLVMGIYVIVT